MKFFCEFIQIAVEDAEAEKLALICNTLSKRDTFRVTMKNDKIRFSIRKRSFN